MLINTTRKSDNTTHNIARAVAISFLILAGLCQAAEYSRADLDALATDGEWVELLEHVKDISPAERDDGWRTMVATASVAALKQISETDPIAAFGVITFLDKEHQSLADSPEWLAQRARSGIASIAICLNEGYYVDKCLSALDGLLAGDPNNAALWFEAASLVRMRANATRALPMLAHAFEHANASQVSEQCAQEGTELISMDGLQSTNEEVAGLAVDIVFKHCAEALVPTAFSAFLEGDRMVAQNTCPAWRSSDRLSEFQQAHCKDMEATQ